jgi:hypothetical protein
MRKIYSIEEFFQFVPEVRAVDKFGKILINRLSGNFLMSVVKDKLFELGLEFIVSVGILQKVSEMCVFQG